MKKPVAAFWPILIFFLFQPSTSIIENLTILQIYQIFLGPQKITII